MVLKCMLQSTIRDLYVFLRKCAYYYSLFIRSIPKVNIRRVITLPFSITRGLDNSTEYLWIVCKCRVPTRA